MLLLLMLVRMLLRAAAAPTPAPGPAAAAVATGPATISSPPSALKRLWMLSMRSIDARFLRALAAATAAAAALASSSPPSAEEEEADADEGDCWQLRMVGVEGVVRAPVAVAAKVKCTLAGLELGPGAVAVRLFPPVVAAAAAAARKAVLCAPSIVRRFAAESEPFASFAIMSAS